MKQTEELKKNVTRTEDGGFLYSFGKKRAVPNCDELLSDSVWKDRLIDKWIYMRDEERSINTFIKHVYDEKRVLQVIYSGEDIYCDGVYKIYSAKILFFPGDEFVIDPQEFSPIYSAFTFPEGSSFIDALVHDGYISSEERSILIDKEKSDDFAKTIYRLKDYLM